MGKIVMETRVKDDLLKGAKAIADEIGESERAAYYLLENRIIPAGKLNGIWIASRSALKEHYRELTSGRRTHQDEKAASV